MLVWIVASALIVAWCAALGMRVFTFDHPTGPISQNGLEILITGWMGILGGMLAWYANPVFLLSLALLIFARNRVHPLFLVCLSLILLALTAHSYSYRSIWDDAGVYPLLVRGAGFWVWMGTMAITGMWLLALAALKSLERRAGKEQAKA